MKLPKTPSPKTFPFVLNVDYVGSEKVREACQEAVEFSRHLQCMIRLEINDVKLTVCGSIMTANDVYTQWEYQQKNLQAKNASRRAAGCELP
jgi:hypothetical protein